jgi:hypothetical protein
MQEKRLAIIESPYAGDVKRNIAYAKRAMHAALNEGYAPIASHLLYTLPGMLDDTNPDERALGIEAGLSWYAVAEICLVYRDLGITPGMQMGIERAKKCGVPCLFIGIGACAKTHVKPSKKMAGRGHEKTARGVGSKD